MCGFTGFLQAHVDSSRNCLESIVTGMALAILHRGPDDAGAWADSESGIALGHRRLSIIDLSAAGHQPMHSSSGQFIIAFNGEIYNHTALRSELQQTGKAPVWRGHSDTETLLSGFDAWGVKATLQRTVGMFAFALWDRVEHCLLLGRDRFGEKPLYYGWGANAFLFGSELKALRAYPGFDNPISRGALALYLQHCTVPAPHSIYEDIFKLEPGCLLTLRLSDLKAEALSIEPYWRLTDAVREGMANPVENETEAVSLLDGALREAIALQAVADVPPWCILVRRCGLFDRCSADADTVRTSGADLYGWL